jgi:hypothetical protein
MLEKHVTCPLLAGPFFLELVGYQGTLHNWIIPGSPLGGHPADSPAFPPAGLGIRRPGSVFDAPVLATLIRTEKHRLVLKMAVAEGPLEGLDHQGG